jgi:hypothetical protein
MDGVMEDTIGAEDDKHKFLDVLKEDQTKVMMWR